MSIKSRLTTAKTVFSDVKLRIIFITIIAIAVVMIGVAYVKMKRSAQTPPGGGSQVASAPGITAVPGLGEPSREYAKLLEQQNIETAKQAVKTGAGAIPTLVRTTYVEGGISQGLSKQTGAASVAGCGIEELKRARASGVTAAELKCRGCSLAALRAAGYTAGELRAAGFSAKELKDAGFSAEELKAAGFSAKELAQAGFSAKELARAGFSAGELKDAGFTAADLSAAGFSDEAIRAAGFGANALNTGDCSVEKLRDARAKGASAADLKKQGCSAAALRAAGFTAAELKAAGFSAKELKDAGFSAGELRAAGFSAADLRAAGYSAKELKDAGFSAKELKDAGFSAGELKDAGFSAKDLKDAGFSAKDLKNAGFSATELKDAGFTPEELKAGGFTDGDLIRAGIAVSASGKECSVDSLMQARASGVSAAELKNRGCSADALRAAGFTAAELKAAGFSDIVGLPTSGSCDVESLKQARANGASASELKNRGCSAAALRAAGFTAAELRAAGFSAKDLKDAGYSAAEILAAGFSPDDLRAAGFNETEIAAAQKALGSASNLPGSFDDRSDWQKAMQKLREQQAQQLSDAEYADFVRQLQQQMLTQANQLFAAWSPIPTQAFVQGAQPAEETPEAKAAAAKQAAEQAAAQNVDIFKAGSIIFAVLDTGVNTDESSPVMATIVTGPLKGSKVLGNFTRVEKKVLLQFSVLSVPKLNNSIGINAVAIDPNTAKTALASKVDNHYLLRYGTLFASSFVTGVGQAFQSAGAQTTVTPIGTFTTIPNLNLGQKLAIALGQVGSQFGSVMAPMYTMPPTVEVKAGSSIGLLLMGDLAVPKS